MKKIEFQAGPVSCSVNPLSFDDALCIGCNRCASVCQVDIRFLPRNRENILLCCIRENVITAAPASWPAGQGGHTSEASADEPDQVCGD